MPARNQAKERQSRTERLDVIRIPGGSPYIHFPPTPRTSVYVQFQKVESACSDESALVNFHLYYYAAHKLGRLQEPEYLSAICLLHRITTVDDTEPQFMSTMSSLVSVSIFYFAAPIPNLQMWIETRSKKDLCDTFEHTPGDKK